MRKLVKVCLVPLLVTSLANSLLASPCSNSYDVNYTSTAYASNVGILVPNVNPGDWLLGVEVPSASAAGMQLEIWNDSTTVAGQGVAPNGNRSVYRTNLATLKETWPCIRISSSAVYAITPTNGLMGSVIMKFFRRSAP